MEEPNLDNLLQQIRNREIQRTEPYTPRLWYNEVGDCIEFQTDDEAFFADRIDNYLTLYRSIDNPSMAIGFKLKDVKALMEKYDSDLNIVLAETLDKEVMTVVSILTKAYEVRPKTIEKEERYSEALGSLFGGSPAFSGGYE